jgi:protein-S-isoprenylcysteine O-methyltransferase Ste14
MMRVPVPWIFVLAYIIGIGLELVIFASSRLEKSTIAAEIGTIVFASGVALAAWAWLIFHNARTTRVPGEVSTALITRGPYRLSRNPMYVGLTLAYVGEAGILRQVLPLAVLPLVIAYLNQVVIPLEESRLEAAFGAAYRQYRSRVRRWL